MKAGFKTRGAPWVGHVDRHTILSGLAFSYVDFFFPFYDFQDARPRDK